MIGNAKAFYVFDNFDELHPVYGVENYKSLVAVGKGTLKLQDSNGSVDEFLDY